MPQIERDAPQTEGERAEADMRERGRQAFDSGNYPEAFNLFQSSLLDTALRWFREEGLTFQRPPDRKLSAAELLVGLAIASQREVASRGEGASHKLITAADIFAAVAEMRMVMEKPVDQTVEGSASLMAELMCRGVMLGQLDGIMNAINLGWLDKLAEHEATRNRRRAGAEKVNAQKASVKESALAEAIRITGRNPMLSAEDLAVKVKEAANLVTTIRTITDWVREWRRLGFIAPQKT